jgi:multiple sugar transport system permease protein
MATAEATAGTIGRVRYGSISHGRRRALFWSYFFLILFVIFFLTPPVYMFVTSLKSSAEISAATNPWWVYHPTLSNYIDLLTQNQFLIFFRNSAIVSVCDFGHRGVPDLPDPGITAVHPAVQDLCLHP